MEHIKDLQEIQIEIKKELGGASLSHLLNYKLRESICYVTHYYGDYHNPQLALCIVWWTPLKEEIFSRDFILLNEQKQALNIFAQSEKFQRELYDAIQIIKNINN